MQKLLEKVIDCYHFVFAFYGWVRFSHQYKKLKIIAVTGTDGKSSTVVLTARLLRKAEKKVAHYSSLSIHNGDSEKNNSYKMTTPGHAKLHKFLAKAAQAGCEYAVVEITSEGIKQWRHWGINFSILVYTNITPEHIERHGSFEKYKHTKLSLLKSLKKDGLVVWNATDEELNKEIKVFAKHKNQAVVFENEVEVLDPFISQNYLLACSVVSELGYQTELKEKEKKLPGRFNFFPGQPAVLVDYAHTPRALDICLQASRQITHGKVIHVFGAAGGGRDVWKRPILAKFSEQLADVHILTEENSFDESVFDIIDDIKKGFTDRSSVHIVPKREDAIEKAFSLACPEDMIVCTAKGSEAVIAGPNRSMRPYNEIEFVNICQAKKKY